MLKQLKIIVLVTGIATLFLSVGTSIGYRHYSNKQTFFAMGLFTGAHSSVPTYAFISFVDNHVVGAEVVSEQRFMYSALGHWPSPANPDRINFFEKYGVDNCSLYVNDWNKVEGYYCEPVHHLWKIRFYESPYQFDAKGWSQGQYKPSVSQAQLIYKEYGVKDVLTQYFYGDTLFKLLRNVQDDMWVNKYRFATKDSTISKP